MAARSNCLRTFGFTDAIPHYGSGLKKMLGTPVIVADGSVIGVMTGH
jgi:hypothetical protein